MQRNDRLRQHREERGWSQEYVAEMLGVRPLAVWRWEQGIHQPKGHNRIELIKLFGRSAEELGLEAPSAPAEKEAAADASLPSEKARESFSRAEPSLGSHPRRSSPADAFRTEQQDTTPPSGAPFSGPDDRGASGFSPMNHGHVSAAFLIRVGLVIAVVFLLVLGGYLGLFRSIGINRVNTSATATAQAATTATTSQQIYAQATSGTPAIDDPLSDDRNKWGVFTTNWGGQCAFTGGAYHLTLSKPGYLIVCTGGSVGVLNNSANFALQVQISIVQGNDGGIVFGDSTNAWYRTYISSSGSYVLTQNIKSSNQSQNLRRGSSSAIKEGLNQVNVFAVIVSNSNFYLYVNNQFVTSANLSAYSQGGAGLSAWSDNQATDVAFSDLKIWTL